jgi:hypothetical protein
MTWIEPDSYIDESGKWSDETNTSASSIEIAYDENTDNIHFLLNQPKSCDKVRIDISKSNPDAEPVPIEIYGYWNGGWHWIEGVTWTSGWQELSLGGTVLLERIKLNFRNDDGSDVTTVNVNNINFGQVGIRPLVNVPLAGSGLSGKGLA